MYSSASWAKIIMYVLTDPGHNDGKLKFNNTKAHEQPAGGTVNIIYCHESLYYINLVSCNDCRCLLLYLRIIAMIITLLHQLSWHEPKNLVVYYRYREERNNILLIEK